MSRFASLARQGTVAGLLLVCLGASTARGVVVSASHDEVTAVAPGDDPGWNNVAHLGSASAVYLGNRWVLTANHVADGPLRLSDGRIFGMVAGSSRQLTNTGVSAFGSPDLKIFRLVDDPGLPMLAIDTLRPPAGSKVVMIGAGRDPSGGLAGWSASGALTLTWTSVPFLQANVLGYNLSDTSTMRWGTNIVASNQILISNNTAGFSTRFDRPGLPYEAQAVLGDSGGGVFRFDDDSWKLVGIITSQQLLSNQPEATAVFGDQSMIADLAAYRFQLTGVLEHVDSPWQNQANYFDVNRSGTVTGLDAQLLIRELLTIGARELSGDGPTSGPLFDVSGDRRFTSTDAFRVINALRGGTANPAVATASASFVPEPSTWTLAALGVLVVALGRRHANRA